MLPLLDALVQKGKRGQRSKDRSNHLGRAALAAHLERVVIKNEVPADKRVCAQCGAAMKTVGLSCCEMLDVVPAPIRLVVRGTELLERSLRVVAERRSARLRTGDVLGARVRMLEAVPVDERDEVERLTPNHRRNKHFVRFGHGRREPIIRLASGRESAVLARALEALSERYD